MQYAHAVVNTNLGQDNTVQVCYPACEPRLARLVCQLYCSSPTASPDPPPQKTSLTMPVLSPARKACSMSDSSICTAQHSTANVYEQTQQLTPLYPTPLGMQPPLRCCWCRSSATTPRFPLQLGGGGVSLVLPAKQWVGLALLLAASHCCCPASLSDLLSADVSICPPFCSPSQSCPAVLSHTPVPPSHSSSLNMD